ncbi:MAG: CotH kinase family protein [Candidatus Latescibacterota bacterium]
MKAVAAVRRMSPLAPALAVLLLGAPAAQGRLPEFYHFSEDSTRLELGGLPVAGLYDEGVLRTFELRFAQADWQVQLAANYDSEVSIAADLIVDGVTYPGVGVRYKGTTSYRRNALKNPFNIDLQFTDPGQDLMGYETLNLHNSAADESFVREVLANHVYRRYIPSPKASFVKLLINGQNWGVYINVQQVNTDLVEEWFQSSRGDRWKVGSTGGMTTPGGGGVLDSTGLVPPGGLGPADSTRIRPAGIGGVRPDSARVPGGMVTPDTTWRPGPQPGGAFADTLVQGGGGGFAGGGGALTWRGTDTTAYQDAYELQRRQSADPWGSLVRLCDVLNNRSLEALADSLDRVLDIDRALWYIAAENLLADSDGYDEKGGDYRLFYEEETGRFHLLQYDANEVLGGGGTMAAGGTPGQGRQFGGTGGTAARGIAKDPFEHQDNASRPLISRLLSVPELRQRYIAHYRTLLAESLDWGNLAPLVQGYRELIESEVEADSLKLGSFAQFQSGFADLQDFVEGRRQYLLSLPDLSRPAPAILSVEAATRAVQRAGSGPLAGAPVQVTATLANAVPVEAVLLYYCEGMAGAFSQVAMADDGAHGDGAAADGVYGGELPPFAAGTLVRYYVEARAAGSFGTASFSPAGAEHDTYVLQVAALRAASTPVVINELMAANGGAVLDPQGEPEDWVELLNVTDGDIDLAGMYLSDAEQNPRQWAFPAGTVLAPGAYLVVWADEDGGDEPGLHASFRLAAGGEHVLLVDADERGNQVLDRVDFPAQEEDHAYGRVPDGTGAFAALSTATPGASNSVPTAVTGSAGTQPPAFRLHANYPNPFNSGTGIAFEVPALAGHQDTPVELAVFDLLGRRVATLVRARVAPGRHEVHWDGRGQHGEELASGVYFYRLTAGDQVATRRLALVR